ncbi:MAG: hypothetical protein U5M51_14415 [Emticicia sp.]|nr:hypothetical protein [Emticicia sp.]
MLSRKKTLFLVIFSLFWLKIAISLAQKPISTDLKDFSEYQKSLKSYYLKLWHAKREEFKDLNEKSFLYYAPTVGLQFGLPSVQFSTRDYANYQRDKKLLKSKLNSLDESLELEMNERLQALRVEYEKVKVEYDKLAVFQGKMKYLKALNAIKLECCTKRECTPEECRRAELEMYEFEQNEKLTALNIKIQVLELEKNAKYGLPNEYFTH